MGTRRRRLWTVAAAAAGYAAGTFPSADLAARLATGGATNLRSAGTGNPGAANAMAVLGPGWGYAVLGADVAKGVLGACLGRALAGDAGAHVGAVAAVVGHCFPWQTGFRGGKGVATSAGQCLATFPAYFPIDAAVAGLTGAGPWRRRARAATLVASTCWVAAALLWWRHDWPNLWGPRPTVALPLAAAASTSVIAYKFSGFSAG